MKQLMAIFRLGGRADVGERHPWTTASPEGQAAPPAAASGGDAAYDGSRGRSWHVDAPEADADFTQF